MWEHFKKLFFGPKGPQAKIQPLVFQDGLLAFRASETLKLGTHQVLAPSKKGLFEVQVQVLSYDPKEDTYRGKVNDEVFALDAMQLERRGEFRLPKAIRVSSSELPGYEGRTEDISLSGARLRIKDEIKTGQYITVRFHFGDSTVPDLSLLGEVRWCAPCQTGIHHCGLRFSNLEKADRATLKRFIQNQAALGAKF